MGRLDDKVAVITGAGRGIGRDIALAMATEGARIVVNDLGGNTDGTGSGMIADDVVDEIHAMGGEAASNTSSVSEVSGGQSLLQTALDNFGGMDILVNNAGIAGLKGALEEQTEDELDRIFAVNVKGPWFACAAVHSHFLENGYGRIVNIASIAGKEGNPGLVPYSMSKAALIGMTKAYAKEVATRGILVNSVAPAVIETEILAQVSDEVKEYMISKIPMGRVGQPGEVAELVLFLSSERCSFSTGFCYDISGGRATY